MVFSKHPLFRARWRRVAPAGSSADDDAIAFRRSPSSATRWWLLPHTMRSPKAMPSRSSGRDPNSGSGRGRLRRGGPSDGLRDSDRLRARVVYRKSRLTDGSGFEKVERSGGGVSLGGVPERTCSLTSGRTIDGIGRRSGGRFGVAADVAGASAERTALSQVGKKPRRGCSTPGVELGRSSSKTPEGRGGRRAQVRRPSGSPGGDGRQIGAARREAEEPQGG